jgi:hypothetical protein
MIDLVKFKQYLSGGSGDKSGPPVSIRASDLDKNFTNLTPIPDKFGIYKVEGENNRGWSLVFRANNRSVSWREIDICVNGEPKKMLVLASEPY